MHAVRHAGAPVPDARVQRPHLRHGQPAGVLRARLRAERDDAQDSARNAVRNCAAGKYATVTERERWFLTKVA